MAWSVVASAIGTNTATMPAHQIGDYLIVGCCRDGSTTPPSLVSGWININAPTGANTFSHRIAGRFATTTSMVTGTWTNATSTIVLVLRNASVGFTANGVANNGTNGTFNYAALTMNLPNGAGGLLGFVFSTDGTSTAAVATAPTGMTNKDSVLDATDAEGVHYQISATSWSSTNVTANVTATWRTYVLEIVDETPAANVVGDTTMGANGMANGVISLCEYTPTFTGTVNKLKGRFSDAGGNNHIRMAVYSKPIADPANLLFHTTNEITSVDTGIHIFSYNAFTNDNGTPNVTSGTPIYIAEWDDSLGSVAIYYNSGTTGQTRLEDTSVPTYPTWPNPIVAVANPFSRSLNMWIEGTPTSGTAAKTKNGLAKASVKNVNALAIASVKTIDGL